MSFDQACLDLARAFLSDEPTLDTEDNQTELANDIQVLIEDFIAFKRDGLAKAEG